MCIVYVEMCSVLYDIYIAGMAVVNYATIEMFVPERRIALSCVCLVFVSFPRELIEKVRITMSYHWNLAAY